jgi:hypothetical protein
MFVRLSFHTLSKNCLFFPRWPEQDNYPLAPPGIMILTPNGRFATGRRLCLSMSDYHPEVDPTLPITHPSPKILPRILADLLKQRKAKRKRFIEKNVEICIFVLNNHTEITSFITPSYKFISQSEAFRYRSIFLPSPHPSHSTSLPHISSLLYPPLHSLRCPPKTRRLTCTDGTCGLECWTSLSSGIRFGPCRPF